MKSLKYSLIALLLPALALALASELSNPPTASQVKYGLENVAALLAGAVPRTVDNVAALRATSKTKYTRAQTLGYAAKGDGGGGVFYMDAAAGTCTDNGGTVILATDGGCWKLATAGKVSARIFGINGTGNERVKLQAALDAVSQLEIPDGLTITLDNTSTVGATITRDNFILSGKGTIKGTNIHNSMLVVTAGNVTITGVTLQGPGTNDDSGTAADEPSLLKIDGTGRTSPINANIEGINVINPGVIGIDIWKSVGVIVKGSTLSSNADIRTFTGNSSHLLRIYASADVRVIGNHMRGLIEGVEAGAFGSDYIFDDFAGTRSGKTRRVVVADNIIEGQQDHSIYFSNETQDYQITGNFAAAATTSAGGNGYGSIKVEGFNVTVRGNYSRDGIVARNPVNLLVANNTVPVASGINYPVASQKQNVYGITIEDVIFKRDAQNIKIIGNNIYTIGGNVDTDAGINVTGAVWAGYQSKIIDLDISGNTVTGFGQYGTRTIDGYGILVKQQLISIGNVAQNSPAEGVKIANNIVTMASATARPSYGVALMMGVNNATVTGNTIKGFSKFGVYSLGVKNSFFGGNTLVANPASGFQRFGFFEDNSNTALHIDSVNNVYGVNQAQGVTAKYFKAAPSTVVQDAQVSFRNENYDISIDGYEEVSRVVWTPATAGRALTLTAARPWGVGQTIEVVNGSAVSFTVNPTATVIAPGTSKKFISISAAGLAFRAF
jgi:hypothetical protein